MAKKYTNRKATKNTTRKKLTHWQKSPSSGLKGRERNLENVMLESGFAWLSRWTDSLRFNLYVDGGLTIQVKLKPRKDGTFILKAEVPDWLRKKIEAAGYQLEKSKEQPAEQQQVPAKKLRVVG